MIGKNLFFNGPKYQGLYTSSCAGQIKFAGINARGSQRYDELLLMAKEGRGRAKRDNCKALELACLKKLRELANIKTSSWDEHSKSKRRVKPKVAHTQHREEADEFEDIALEDSDDEGLDLAALDSNETAFV